MMLEFHQIFSLLWSVCLCQVLNDQIIHTAQGIMLSTVRIPIMHLLITSIDAPVVITVVSLIHLPVVVVTIFQVSPPRFDADATSESNIENYWSYHAQYNTIAWILPVLLCTIDDTRHQRKHVIQWSVTWSTPIHFHRAACEEWSSEPLQSSKSVRQIKKPWYW